MAVQEGPSFKRYAANGIATIYAIPFLLLDAGDLVVTLDGVVVSSGFTLSGIGNPESTATFAAAPSGDLLFRLVIPFQRLADYQLNGDFLSSTVNNDLDRIWLALKELRRDDGRFLAVDPLEPEGIPPLPVAALRQLRLLAFDPDGDPVPSNLTLAQLEEQPALALASAAAAQASAEMAALSETAAGGYASAASTSAGTAGAAATLAGKWAEEAEDVPVTTGPDKFSAKHWAAKAAAALSSVQASITALAARVTILEGIFSKKESSGALTITLGGVISFNHSMGVVPKLVRLTIKCLTNDGIFVVNDIVEVGSVMIALSQGHGLQVKKSSTNVSVYVGNTSPFALESSTTVVNGTANRWELYIDLEG